MAAKVLVRKGKSNKSKKPVASDVYARPGMIAVGCGDEGQGPIVAATEAYCIYVNERGTEIALKWAEVLIGSVKPDPGFMLAPPKRHIK